MTELKEAEARIAHLAYHDGLTALANRQLFEETLVLAVERAGATTRRRGRLLGPGQLQARERLPRPPRGDLLLSELADRLRTCTRETDLVARQGGDEFLVLLADLDPSEAEVAAKRVADRVVEVLMQPFGLQGTEFHARGSIGISLYREMPSTRDAVEERRHRDVPGEADRTRRPRVLRERR